MDKLIENSFLIKQQWWYDRQKNVSVLSFLERLNLVVELRFYPISIWIWIS